MKSSGAPPPPLPQGMRPITAARHYSRSPCKAKGHWPRKSALLTKTLRVWGTRTAKREQHPHPDTEVPPAVACTQGARGAGTPSKGPPWNYAAPDT